MKPNVDDAVWCIYKKSIFKGIVYALGKESFILKGYDSEKYVIDTYEWKYKDFGCEWFVDFNLAKEKLIMRYDATDEDLKEIEKDYFEL